MSKNSIIRIYVVLTVFIVGLVLGWILKPGNQKAVTNNTNNTNLIHETRLQEGYKFINPLLECDAYTPGSTPVNSLRISVENYVKQRISENKVTHVSVYYRDLNNGPWFGVNEDALFSPASLLKVPLMIAYFKLAETDPKILDQKIKNTVTDPETRYKDIVFKPKQQIEIGTEYSVNELIKHMIVFSDNVAAELLFNSIDKEKQAKIYTDLDVNVSKINDDPTGDIVSIKDYATFFRILYNASYLNGTFSEKALELLSQSTFTEGIVSGVPNDVAVSHKFGERYHIETSEKQLHDCGIVYAKGHPYLICIMTKGGDYLLLSQTISEISKMIYSFISSQ